MSKKNEKMKKLKKQVSTISKMYMEKKPDKKRMQLKTFINDKVGEIITYMDVLKKNKRKQPDKHATVAILPNERLEPSVELLTQLQHKQNGVEEKLQEIKIT